MANIIEPRVLRGFRDFLPEAEIERRSMLEALEATFRSYGFVPIDTPALEYAEILLGKSGGETEKQVYRFHDHGDREVALRFDLTVPFARFLAEHSSELSFPFKRYHMAKVWRGENTQKGRYREFMQCDFDIVGTEAAGADFEILSIIVSSMDALGIPRTTVKVNHRGVFNAFLARIGAETKAVDVLRLVDKLEKIGEDELRSQLGGLVGESSGDVLDFISKEGDALATLDRMERLSGGQTEASQRLRVVLGCARDTGIGSRIQLDPAIMRGHDYYTGIVFETYLDELPSIGQICGGGRYDNLASLYTKQRIPGVGASVGIDRLITGLEGLGRIKPRAGYADVLVFCVDDGLDGWYQGLARAFRDAGISCEVYPERKKLPLQFAYAERKGIRFGLICGGDERAKGVVAMRDLTTRESFESASPAEAAAKVAALLRGV